MKEFLADILANIQKFEGISHLLISNEGGKTVGSAMAGDKSVLVLGVTDLIDVFETPVCLGNLKYLAKILSMEQIRGKQGTAEPVIGKSTADEDIIQEIRFKGPRISATYEATDPKVASVRRPNIKKMEWSLDAKIEPQHYREFSDAADLIKIVNAKADSFEVEGGDGEMSFTFADKTHTTTLKLGTAVNGSLPGTVTFSIPRVRPALQMVTEHGGGTIEISQSAMKLWSKSSQAEYTIVIPKRIVG